MIDQRSRNGQFLVLGSASPSLLQQSSETLAGRISYRELSPLMLNEVGADRLFSLWLSGGFPRSFLSEHDTSISWRENYIRTFLERDLPMLGFRRSSAQMRRFWMMFAHSHGQIQNHSKLAQSLDVSGPSIKGFIDMMVDAFMLRVLPPYIPNIKKRLVKSPKVYLRDSGLLHSLLGLETLDDLMGHPIYGSSFEGFVIEQILSSLSTSWQPFFYRTSTGEEVDLVLTKGNEVVAIECKASMSPSLSKQNLAALEAIKPTRAFVVSLVEDAYPLRADVVTCSVAHVIAAL